MSTLPSSTVVAHTRMRRAVVRTVTASAAIPQFSVQYDLSVAPLTRARDQHRSAIPDLSVTDLLHGAVARTLPDHPLLNASFDERHVELHHRVNLAYVLEFADGMLTPVITDADRLTLGELVRERRRLTEAALTARIGLEELTTGTFTVSNLGPVGIHRFTAMVVPPQAAVLAVGRAGDDGRLTLTLSCDHRVVDGAPAARFLHALGRRLADPVWLSTLPDPDGPRP